MPGSKIINYVVLAHKWFYDFMTRPDMRVLRASGTRLAPTEVKRRCGARNNLSGIYCSKHLK